MNLNFAFCTETFKKKVGTHRCSHLGRCECEFWHASAASQPNKSTVEMQQTYFSTLPSEEFLRQDTSSRALLATSSCDDTVQDDTIYLVILGDIDNCINLK